MEVFENILGEKRSVNIKLYPNNFKKSKAPYHARTVNEKTLDIDQICAAMVERGGFTGDYKDLVINVKKFYDEVAYQLCDGYTINTGYYSIYPNIKGGFISDKEPYNKEKNPINFKFRTRAKLKRLIDHISVVIVGYGGGNCFIEEFFDYDENSVNHLFAEGDQFSIKGKMIKIAGNAPDCGLYFVPVLEPSKAVKVERIAENSPGKITGIVPKTEHQQNRLEIRTQFTGTGNVLLKSPRVITSHFILESA